MKSTQPGPKQTPLNILVTEERKWLDALRLLQNGSPKKKSYNRRWEFDSKLKATTHFKSVTIPAVTAEPETIAALVSAKTIGQIHEAVNDSKILGQDGELAEFGKLLQQKRFVAGILAAKKYRFPKSNRPTSKAKQLIHIARAMAGIESGDRPATSIQRLRLLKHGEECPCAPCWLERYSEVEALAQKQIESDTGVMESYPPMGVLRQVKEKPAPRRKLGSVLIAT